VVNAVKFDILQAGINSMEMGKELRYCLACPKAFAWVIGAVDAVLEAFFSCATTDIACFTSGVYVV
jgi:hypothetical protein